MNTTPEQTVIGALVLALTAMGGTLGWVVRMMITRSDGQVERADERVKLLETERAQTLSTLLTNIASISHTLELMMDFIKELRSWSEWDRQSRGGGGKPPP